MSNLNDEPTVKTCLTCGEEYIEDPQITHWCQTLTAFQNYIKDQTWGDQISLLKYEMTQCMYWLSQVEHTTDENIDPETNELVTDCVFDEDAHGQYSYHSARAREIVEVLNLQMNKETFYSLDNIRTENSQKYFKTRIQGNMLTVNIKCVINGNSLADKLGEYVIPISSLADYIIEQKENLQVHVDSVSILR